MRQHIEISVFLFAAALTAPVAEATPTEYTINFTVQNGTGPTAGSFIYDPATNTFTDFTVTWDGVVWDLTASANNPQITSPAPSCLGGLTGGAASFAMLNRACYPAAPGGGNNWLSGDNPPVLTTQFFNFFSNQSSSVYIHLISLGEPAIANSQGSGQWSITPVLPAQVRYVTHLDAGDSNINITNDGLNSTSYGSTSGLATGDGNLCVGVYAFDENEELQSCCTCLVTPNGLISLSAKAISATSLTGESPTSLVVKLLAWSTTAGASSTAPPGTPAPPTSSSCNASIPGMLAGGMHAWGTALHSLPTSGYTVTETPFSIANLSVADLAGITQSCEFNQINGSAQSGQCKGCAEGGQ